MFKSVGDILVGKNLITQEQLDKYSESAKIEHQTLVNYLKDNQLIKPEEIAQAFADQISAPYIAKVEEEMADPTLLEQVPFKFLRENSIIPIKYENKITIVTSNPNSFQPVDELGMIFDGDTITAIATDATIIDAINRYYPLEGSKQVMEGLGEEKNIGEEDIDLGDIEDKDIMSMAQEAPIIKLVNQILFQAIKRGASDIHIQPLEKEVKVRYRIDGILHDAFNPPKRIQGALISRIKIMADLNIAEKRLPQDGRIEIKVADKPIDLRVSILPVVQGEKVVMRILDKSKTFGKLESIGMSERDLKLVLQTVSEPNGILLMSGPTGSGKTSTLYSILSRLNTPEVSVVTVEDPVEYQMASVSQVQVNAKIGRTFAGALRSILRQDPNIIMIGEIRDAETATIAMQASLTGHLVLSTVHTNDAPSTMTRLIDMGLEPFLVASTVSTVIAQRLVRKLDENKEKYTPPAEQIEALGLTKAEADKITFYKPTPSTDSPTGYKGRVAIFEVMQVTSSIAQLAKEKTSADQIREAAKKDGMVTLLEDGIEKIKEGLTTVEEVLSVAVSVQSD
jgi:type II secretory ATPase GspE/PulE/Tfp pilus assembly ATPase PilB-like protein